MVSVRDWIEKYKSNVQNEEIIKLLNFKPIDDSGPWSFLKLAFLWSFTYYNYTPIIGQRYSNMYYVDMFGGSGLSHFKDYSGNEQILLGSPVLMATINTKFPFKNCLFCESEPKKHNSLENRLDILNDNKKLTCARENCKVFSDCNNEIDEIIKILRKNSGTHFLLFVDPYSTEIKWSTMEKLLSIKYPFFDMIFNFLPFGINRKMTKKSEDVIDFFGEPAFAGNIEFSGEGVLDRLESYYIQKLRKFSDKIKTIKTIRIQGGTGAGGFYYDLLYTTRKENPAWIKGIEHLKEMLEKMSGSEVNIIIDPNMPSLEKFI
jgi:three-Cys-motif partner protein